MTDESERPRPTRRVRLRAPRAPSPSSPASTPGDVSPLRLLDRSATGHRGKLARIAALALVGGFAEAGVLVIIARLAFALASGDDRVKVALGPIGTSHLGVGTLVAVAGGLVVGRVGLQFVQAAAITRTYAEVIVDVRCRLMRLYVGSSWALQSGEREGRLQELVTGFAHQTANSVLLLANAAVAFTSLFAFLLTAFIVNPIAAVVVMVVAIGAALALRPVRHAVRRRSRRSSAAGLAYATAVTETASTMQEIRVFNVEERVLGRIEGDIRRAAELDRQTRYLSMLAPTVYQGMALLLIVGAIGAVHASGVSRLASLGGIVLIMVRSLSYGQQLQSFYQALHAAAPSFEILADEEQRYADAAVRRDGRPFDHIGPIALEHVWYEYEPGRPVLSDIDLQCTPGEIIGIIGPSGAGKSTLIQLILRLREPTAGRILADGRDVADLSITDWYRHVSFVPQEPKFFAGTVAENLAFYRDLDQGAIERAAKQANLHDEIVAMHHGYDTSIGERGSHLSGGQRQRLAIARALVEEPEVLVLDEPTSSLDVRSESLIRDTLADLSPRATVFIIAHRLSTLHMCHKIMVVRDGRLEGFDTPSRLEAANPFYQEALRLSGLR
jgi:ABC-type multidrug transport system fused ATPase/permease subunit